MANGLDALVGTLPVILVGGMAMNMTERMFPRGQTQSIGIAQSSQPGWSSLTKKEAINLFGKKKVDMVQSHPGKEYKWGYDKLKFANGQFWLA